MMFHWRPIPTATVATMNGMIELHVEATYAMDVPGGHIYKVVRYGDAQEEGVPNIALVFVPTEAA